MAELQSTNVQGTLCVNGVAVGGGKDFKYCCFTASSTFTPSQDLVDGDGALNVLAVGGGGAAGTCAVRFCCAANCQCGCINTSLGAGGGAGFFNGWEPITATDACTVTVGAGAAANEASFEGGTTGVLTENSTNGGTTTFGNVSVVGGGNAGFGHSCFASGTPSSTSETCPYTRNAHPSRGGGAQYYSYGWCYKGWGVPPGGDRTGGGSGNTAETTFDNEGQATGSINWGIFAGDSSNSNLGSGNPYYYGMGGNANVAGGPTGCRSRIITQTSSTFSSATSSIKTPDRFFGAGGNGERFCACSQGNAVPSCVEVQGVPGNDGIIVLTWYE